MTVKTIVVLEVVVDGQISYIAKERPSCHDLEATTTNLESAYNFHREDPSVQQSVITDTLNSIVLPGDASFPKSGLRVDAVRTVTYKLTYVREHSTIARTPRG